MFAGCFRHLAPLKQFATSAKHRSPARGILFVSTWNGTDFRIKLRLRRFGRRHTWLIAAIRSFMIFSAAFGGAYGFITGSRSESSGYNAHAFAIGASFLFAIACVALATLSIRIWLMRKTMHKIALHNEALADRNWELQEAAERARSLFEPQGDLIVMRDRSGHITFVNDAYCQLAGAAARRADRQRFDFAVLEQGDSRNREQRHTYPRPEDRNAARAAMDRLARGAGTFRRRPAGRTAMRRPRRHRPHRNRTRAGGGPRPGRCRQPRQVALPRDGVP